MSVPSEAKIRSPRAPSTPLGDALARAIKIYQKERRNVAPVEIVAQHMGYTNANNGAAAHAIASLRYFGLIERPKDGHLAVRAEVEQYLLSTSEAQKRDLRRLWMQTPIAFKAIIGRYPEHLPSDATLRFELIGQGFSPAGADGFISVFKKSAHFAEMYTLNGLEFCAAGHFGSDDEEQPDGPLDDDANEFAPEAQASSAAIPAQKTNSLNKFERVLEHTHWDAPTNVSVDKIPVRLSNGRRAWLVIPSPFYEHDKARLKAQIDLLLTDEV